ncbi:hypothetical protein [Gynurincola endophyticus]|uniref:hypothetical protein n=1 Tax=Gynurincola endophyticus TaxID=2479004 RepID=UPI000F8D8077|nr:hypothetical protein [Gynurincola endophyticus]
MERLQQLIGKLNEQFGQNADPAQLLVTIKLIEAELVRKTASQFENSQVESKSRIAVVMPAAAPVYVPTQPEIVEKPKEEVPFTPPPVSVEVPSVIEQFVQEEQDETEETVANALDTINPLVEVPTLAHQQVIKELNEIIGSTGTSASLNDRLKSDQMELGLKLNSTAPVKDLKKAIGINERYTFINELFRGDEAMFERSLKTINSFKIYAEAAYWIERELKVKQGWDEGKPVTQEFYLLVKRRFQ